MEKRLSQRKSGKFLAAAVASVGLASFAAPQSNASLVVDLRASAAGAGGILGGPKSVTAAGIGSTVTMQLFARISGTDSVQTIVDISPDQDGTKMLTTNNDTLNSLVGSFQSVGALKGNMARAAGPYGTANSYVGTLNFSPFDAPGKQNGTAADWDGDGDLDIGAVGTDPAALFAARAAAPTQGAIVVGTGGGNGYSSGPGSFGAEPQDTIISPEINELRIGTLRFVVTAAGLQTLVNFVPRDAGGDPAGVALWFEDGSSTGKNPIAGSFSVLAPVNITIVPEPASLGLLGLASLGLLARRRKSV